MKLTLKTKITLLVVFAVALPSLFLGYLAWSRSLQMAVDIAEFSLTGKLRGDIASAQLYLEQLHGTLVLTGGELRDSDERTIGSDHGLVDRLKQDLGVEATVFVRDGGDFRRVTTTIINPEGRRAVGTTLGTASAAHGPVSAGRLYIGRAVILGEEYLTAYEPLFGASREVTGILFLGIPLTEIQQLAQARVRTLMVLFAVTAVALVVILGVVVWVGARQVLFKPVGMLERLADDLQSGKTSDAAAIEVRGSDELAMLATHLKKAAAVVDHNAGIADRIASGDLSMEVKLASTDDKPGLALQGMLDRWNSIFAEIRSASNEFSTGSGQISDASQSLSQGATESAASLQQISASATQIGQQAKTNAETATHANQLAVTAKEAAETGAQRMESLNGSMAAITESSNQIAKIIKTIDDIAFQTNILALNAAVEAARAGRHGKGFAVVAEEVRSLAARSAKAARETADLIEGSSGRVEEGNRIAQETAEALAEIVGGIVKVGDLVGEMAAASNEQAQGIAQISQGLMQIDQVTQQNTATAEETAAAAEELTGQAAELRGLIGQFKLKETGQEASGSPASSRPAATPKQKPKLAAGSKEAKTASRPVAKPKAALPAGGGWESMEKKPSKPASNEDIISLEDKEFGRY